jgi:FkbM family methyltransferase
MEWLRLTSERYHKLYHSYSATFDCNETIRNHAEESLVPRDGFLTNFLGTIVKPSYFDKTVVGKEGDVEPIPIPGNWHACMSEWGACLRALDLAQSPFTIVELGCGWGCWLNNMAVAARNKGFDYELIGVEGDPHHIDFAKETCQLNGISSKNLELHHGIAAATNGVALFPKQTVIGKNWGLEPIFSASQQQQEEAVHSGKYTALPMLSLQDVIGTHNTIDLLHLDIQGGERNLIENSLTTLSEKVAYMFVATHSRRNEKSIKSVLRNQHWKLEIERPAIYKMQITGPRLKIDGVQGWRNTQLLPL